MKVILIKDVKGIGRAHQEIEAKDGYALNFLIPKKFAIASTTSSLKEAQGRQKQMKQRSELDAKLLAQNLASLAETRVVIKMKANEKGHLYDAVAASEISAAVKSQARIDLPEDAIKLDRPIKEVGEFEVPVAAGETFGKFKLVVEAE